MNSFIYIVIVYYTDWHSIFISISNMETSKAKNCNTSIKFLGIESKI